MVMVGIKYTGNCITNAESNITFSMYHSHESHNFIITLNENTSAIDIKVGNNLNFYGTGEN